MSDRIGNPEDRFSHVASDILLARSDPGSMAPAMMTQLSISVETRRQQR